ncbi:MAG TPA: hypothetical protein VD886_20100, partial [Herpetosiphonaceae bacterium]|nr:hypothetical protein [Herpetosiphonaceae bacterium]
GQLCASVYSSGQSQNYACSATVRSGEPFSVTYAISGDWGSEVVTRSESIVPPAVGGALSSSFDPVVTPAMLRLHGVLRDDANQPLANTKVRVYNNNYFSPNQHYVEIHTDAEGRYSAEAVLRGDNLSGPLSYAAYYGEVAHYEEGAFSAAPRQITAVERTMVVTERTLQFQGQVGNALVAGMAVPINKLEVRANGQRLCAWQDSYGSAGYLCSATITGTAPLSVTYVLTGTWGSATVARPGTVMIPPVGARMPVRQDLQVSPTTVAITGVVRAAGGAPLPNVQVYAASSAFAGRSSSSEGGSGPATVDATTGPDGVYRAYALARPEAVTGTLDFQLEYGSAAMEVASAPFGPINAGQLTSFTRDLEFNVRQVIFHGDITNALVTTLESPVAADAITVTDQLGNVLCADEGDNYWCSVPVTTMGAFPVSYVVAGPWGRTTLAGSVEAGTLGSGTYVQRDIAVAPPTLRLRGIVRDQDSQPIDYTNVTVGGPDVLGAISGYTDGGGAYDLYVPVRGSGTLILRVRSASGVYQTDRVPFAAGAGITEVLRDVSHVTRELYVRGYINNAATDRPLESARLVATSGGEAICSWTGPSFYYTCDVALTATAAVSATFTVSGEWGSAVITTTLPAGQAGRSAYVDLPLLASPSTLRLSGRLLDGAGEGLGDTTVRVFSDSFIEQDSLAYGYTDGDGAYEIFAVLKQGVGAGDLRYEAFVDGAPLIATGSFTAQPGQITEVSRDIAP